MTKRNAPVATSGAFTEGNVEGIASKVDSTSWDAFGEGLAAVMEDVMENPVMDAERAACVECDEDWREWQEELDAARWAEYWRFWDAVSGSGSDGWDPEDQARFEHNVNHEPRANEFDPTVAFAKRIGRVNIVELLEGEPPPVEWAIPRVLPRGGLMTLYAPAGLGKSLMALDWCVQQALGGEIFGEKVRQQKVLYIDLENDPRLIRDRLLAMGVTAEQAAVVGQWLVYSLLGGWPTLDTPEGGKMLVEAIDTFGIDVVVIDTTQRVISGRENDSDTFRALHTFAMRELKRRGISTIRLDHAGKDAERGTRGSSGKNDDVDLIYRLSRLGADRFRLTREKNRYGLDGGEHLNVLRLTDPLRHVLATSSETSATDLAEWSDVVRVIEALDDAGVPESAGRDKSRAALKGLGIPTSTGVLAKAVKQRKERGQA